MHTSQQLPGAKVAARFQDARRRLNGAWVRRRRLLGIGLAVALVSGCTPVVEGPPFDVLIYVLDACRADRTGAYGYEKRPTTPTIDALADDPDSVVYLRNYVASNWTKPATASLFTGRYVHEHGVTNLHTETENGLYRAEMLADDFVTLAERLRDTGYATYGLVTSHHLAPRYGFDQGFDIYLDPDDLKVGDVGRNTKLIELVEDSGTAYFAYVHQNACHVPFRHEDRDPELMAEFGFEYDEESRAAQAVDFTTSAIKKPINDGELALTPEDTRFLSLVYDAKYRQIDLQVVAPIIDELRRIKRWDRTLFILTADHGEELYEHRGYAHGHALWDVVTHVPMIVKFPKGMRPEGLRKRVGALTSNVDLYPSILELVGLQAPEGLPGRPIFGSPSDRAIMTQGLETWAILEGWDKLIVEPGGDRLLFDLEADPLETHNLAGSRPERVEELAAIGEAALTYSGAVATPEVETELSPEVVERLRSLGYLD